MTLIFNKEFAINPQSSQSSSGGSDGIPKNYMQLFSYDENWEAYTFLCSLDEVENIHSTADNSWSGEFNGEEVMFSNETNTETGEQEIKIYYGANYVDTKMKLSPDYFTDNYPIE